MFWYLAKIPVRAAAMPTAMVVLMGSIACVVPEHTSIHSSRMCRVLGFISHKCHRFIKQSRKKTKAGSLWAEWVNSIQSAGEGGAAVVIGPKVRLRLLLLIYFRQDWQFARDVCLSQVRMLQSVTPAGTCTPFVFFSFFFSFFFLNFKYLCFTIFFHTMWSLELCS